MPAMSHSDEEEDYMTMVFDDAPKSRPETSLQRAARLRREAEARSQPKSKAEREAEEEVARQEALATAMPTSNKGFKMMAKFGFKHGDTLGKSENARKEPIELSIKEDKSGIGLESEKKRKFRLQAEKVLEDAKRTKVDQGDYRDLRRQQQKEKQHERDLNDAQKTAERLEEEKSEGKDTSEVPLKSIPVLWRSLARHRLEKLRERRERQHFKDSLTSRFGSHADDGEDDDYNIALGRDTEVPFPTDEIDDDDLELEEFESQPVADRLQQVADFLRKKHNYCFWCGYQYPDPAMDGCPGSSEEAHD